MVGALGFVADVGTFNLLRFAGGEGPLYDYPLTAKVVSGIIATIVAWLGNRYWTFSHARREKALPRVPALRARGRRWAPLIAHDVPVDLALPDRADVTAGRQHLGQRHRAGPR